MNLTSSEFSSGDYKELIKLVGEEKSSLSDVRVIDKLVYNRTNVYDNEVALEDHTCGFNFR